MKDFKSDFFKGYTNSEAKLSKQDIKKLKEEFRDIFWAYHFRRNIKLNDERSLKRLKELQKIFEKHNITIV